MRVPDRHPQRGQQGVGRPDGVFLAHFVGRAKVFLT